MNNDQDKAARRQKLTDMMHVFKRQFDFPLNGREDLCVKDENGYIVAEPNLHENSTVEDGQIITQFIADVLNEFAAQSQLPTSVEPMQNPPYEYENKAVWDSEGHLVCQVGETWRGMEIAEALNVRSQSENEIAELRSRLEATLVILRRVEDVMYGGAVDHGIEDDISTLKSQIRKLLKTPDEEQVFEVEL